MTIQVQRAVRDRFPQIQEVWAFWYDERYHALRVRSYRVERHDTVRHKFKVAEEWSQFKRGAAIPSLPADVIAEAIATFTSGVTFRPWEDR